MLYFSWLVYYNKNLSWENLMKRQWHGPSRCCMCESAEKANLHMFFKCTSLLEIWQVMANLYGFPLVSHASSQDAFIWWSQQKESWRPIILIVLWCAWRWRNNKLFNDAKELLKDICQSIILIYHSIPKILPNPSAVNRNVQVPPSFRSPRAFFDGASQQNSCGAGVFIQIDENLQYHLSWNAGVGTNNLAEAKALAALLAFCCFLDIKPIYVYGDSKTMVDHVNGNGFVGCPHLSMWMDRIMFFLEKFAGINNSAYLQGLELVCGRPI